MFMPDEWGSNSGVNWKESKPVVIEMEIKDFKSKYKRWMKD